ncbi:MAG: radical SAM protein [Candidatus Sericytochromatia bacterium]|nr:radical SAM protein [Candidatus Sericytochromatia bacterium]
MSIDVTSLCNLRCAHCYWWEQPHEPEMDIDAMLALLADYRRRHPSIVHASWVGGEPLIRKERIRLLTEGAKLFPFNHLVTNGTIPFPDLPGFHINVSLDGPEAEHERIRGKGTYAKIRRHILTAKQPVALSCVVTRLNADGLEALCEEWMAVLSVSGINFSFYTPMHSGDDPIWLPPAERDAVLDRLLLLKDHYGDRILLSRAMIAAYRSDRAHEATGDNCRLKWASIALDAQGQAKAPCILGPKADCERCGCVVPFMLRALKGRDAETLLITSRLFT